MAVSIPASTLEKFSSFGDLLRYLRRAAGLTQFELSVQVGYSHAQISRLEQNLRLPDIPTIEARFIPALSLELELKIYFGLCAQALYTGRSRKRLRRNLAPHHIVASLHLLTIP